MSALRACVEVAALQALLTGLRLLMALASRRSDHFRRQVTRNMLVEMPRTDGVDTPVLVPGNPVKLSRMTEGPETRVPWVGEHTSEVLATELGLDAARLADLRARHVIS